MNEDLKNIVEFAPDTDEVFTGYSAEDEKYMQMAIDLSVENLSLIHI